MHTPPHKNVRKRLMISSLYPHSKNNSQHWAILAILTSLRHILCVEIPAYTFGRNGCNIAFEDIEVGKGLRYLFRQRCVFLAKDTCESVASSRRRSARHWSRNVERSRRDRVTNASKSESPKSARARPCAVLGPQPGTPIYTICQIWDRSIKGRTDRVIVTAAH